MVLCRFVYAFDPTLLFAWTFIFSFFSFEKFYSFDADRFPPHRGLFFI